MRDLQALAFSEYLYRVLHAGRDMPSLIALFIRDLTTYQWRAAYNIFSQCHINKCQQVLFHKITYTNAQVGPI